MQKGYNRAMKKKVALVIDNEHFIKQSIPEWEEKFELRIFNPPRSPPEIKTPLDLIRVLRNKIAIRTQLPKLAKWADIIFCEWATHYLKWLSNKNYGNILACRMHRFELDRHYHEIKWNNVDSVLFISEAMERKFHEKGDYSGKTYVTYDNLNFDNFPLFQKEKTMQIGMLGNIIPRKGVLEFIKYFRDLDLLDIKLSIAGKAKDTKYFDDIKKYIFENKLENKISIEGYVNDLNKWYNSNDCIISNSEHEGTQTSIVEGVATGCWAISRAWDGAKEIVDEKGLFTNSKELKKCLELFYSWDSNKRNKNINDARKKLINTLTNRPKMHQIISKF